jgi:hypothetical protein
MAKRILFILALLLLSISLVLLVWGFIPLVHHQEVLTIPPEDLKLPLPSGFLPRCWFLG